ncbi:hypothetical protein Tco_1020837 [Tanacetum coccineum]
MENANLPTNNQPALPAVLRAKLVQELHELQTISVFVGFCLESIEQLLNNPPHQYNDIDVTDLEPDTPLKSPFLDLECDSNDREVPIEPYEYGDAEAFR